MEEYFLSLREFKENINKIDLEEKYNTLEQNNEDLVNKNNELETKVRDFETKIDQYSKKINEKEEEIASYRKSSILASMSKQIDELKSYISILEKQIKNSKIKEEVREENKIIVNEEAIGEVIESENKDNNSKEVSNDNNINSKEVNTDEVNNGEELVEHEIVDYNGKSYYKIKKKIYKINKDKSIGSLFGKIKNGIITREN